MRSLVTLLLLFFYLTASGNEYSDWTVLLVYPNASKESLLDIRSVLSEEENLMMDEAFLLNKNNAIYLYKIDGNYFLHIDCRLNYWLWSKNQWQLQLDYQSTGDYCSSHLIFKDSLVMSLGGYGFWENKFDLFLLNGQSGKPEFVPTQNQPNDYHSFLISRLRSGVLFLWSEEYNGRVSDQRFLREGKYLDLNQLTWNDLSFVFFDKGWKDALFSTDFYYFETIDLADYTIFFYSLRSKTEIGILVLDKISLNLSVIDIPYSDLIPYSAYLKTDKNKVLIVKENGSKSVSFDLSDYLPKSKLIAQLSIEENPWSWHLNVIKWLFIGCGILIFGCIVWKVRFNSPKDGHQSQQEEPTINLENQEYSSLTNLKGQTINQSKMDEILGLDSISNLNLKKAQRARKIRLINNYHESKYGTPLIFREKDAQDRRMICYRIDKFLETPNNNFNI